MNNNYSQDNYVLNKDTETPLPFETQDEKTQNMDQFQQYIEFQEVLVRIDFLKRVYLLLTLEFLINFGMIALGLYKKLLNLFVNTNFDFLLPCPIECEYDLYKSIYCKSNGVAYCIIHPTPTWLFYISQLFHQFYNLHVILEDILKENLLIITQLQFYILFFLDLHCIFMALILGIFHRLCNYNYQHCHVNGHYKIIDQIFVRIRILLICMIQQSMDYIQYCRQKSLWLKENNSWKFMIICWIFVALCSYYIIFSENL